MPELPEVQTTVNGLQLIIKNCIVNIKINTTKLRYLIPNNYAKQANNSKILKIYRIAKYIIFDLNNRLSLIFHLGMSGRMRILNKQGFIKKKHDHILFFLKNKKILVFNDPRKFGFVDFARTSELMNKKYLSKLGIDPFDSEMDQNYLYKKFKNSQRSIKQILLDQKIITGIGNIYACEILYDAKISPFVKAQYLKIKNIKKLIKSIRKILNDAIVSGGTSIKNYVSADGTLGSFQNKFKVYKKDGKQSKFKVRKFRQHGRSTYYCPSIQKSKYNPNF